MVVRKSFGLVLWICGFSFTNSRKNACMVYSASKQNVAFVPTSRVFFNHQGRADQQEHESLTRLLNWEQALFQCRGGASSSPVLTEKVEEVEELVEDGDDVSVDGPSTSAGHKEDDDEHDDEMDLEEQDEDDNEQEAINDAKVDVKLTASTLKSMMKTKEKDVLAKVTTSKKAVNEKLLSSKKTSTRRRGILRMFHVPYIVKACLNPLTVFSMTKAYFASLFNLNYLTPDTSQDLRSALEAKAKKGGPPGTGKGRRKMKRGQAKTLSDLPQLST